MLLHYIKQRLASIRKRIFYFRNKSKIEIAIPYTWVGSEYGGFYANLEMLSARSVVYSFGTGEDITFDEEIHRITGAKVYGFDPTPRAIAYAEKCAHPWFMFTPVGIGIKDGTAQFHLPKADTYVSGSMLKTAHLKEESITVDMQTLVSIMKRNGHDHIDLLKMDIEGSEYAVLDFILQHHIPCSQLLVEFHDRFISNGPALKARIMALLRTNGYRLFAFSERFEEISFIKLHS